MSWIQQKVDIIREFIEGGIPAAKTLIEKA